MTNVEMLMVSLLLISIIVGALVAWADSLSDLWEAGSFAGKFVTIILAVILLPGIITYFVLCFLGDFLLSIRDFLFPRKSGYTMQIQYDEETYRALQGKKIYCEHWGQIDIPSSVIVFLCKADWEKALKYFPELSSKIRKY